MYMLNMNVFFSAGGLDNVVKLWDVNRIFDEQDSEGVVNVPATM